MESFNIINWNPESTYFNNEQFQSIYWKVSTLFKKVGRFQGSCILVPVWNIRIWKWQLIQPFCLFECISCFLQLLWINVNNTDDPQANDQGQCLTSPIELRSLSYLNDWSISESKEDKKAIIRKSTYFCCKRNYLRKTKLIDHRKKEN